MKSLVYQLQAPKKLELIEENIDSIGETQICAETFYSAISPGTEIAAWQGKPPLRPSKVYPRLQGYCNLARVIKVGKKVSTVSEGDWVLTHQSHRSHILINESDVLVGFSELTTEQAKRVVTTYLFHLGYSALLTGGYFPGHNVSIIGLGALGYTTASLVELFGGKPHIISSQTGRESVFNSDYVSISSREFMENDDSRLENYDITILTSDRWEDYLLSLKLLKLGGTGVLLSFPGRDLPLPSFNPLDSSLLYDKQLSLKYAGYVTEKDVSDIDVRFTLKKNMNYLSQLILDGRLKTEALSNYVRKWDELDSMYEELSTRKVTEFTGILEWK